MEDEYLAEAEPLLQFFKDEPFASFARQIVVSTRRSEERAHCLRHLLHAQAALIRARLLQEPDHPSVQELKAPGQKE